MTTRPPSRTKKSVNLKKQSLLILMIDVAQNSFYDHETNSYGLRKNIFLGS